MTAVLPWRVVVPRDLDWDTAPMHEMAEWLALQGEAGRDWDYLGECEWCFATREMMAAFIMRWS